MNNNDNYREAFAIQRVPIGDQSKGESNPYFELYNKIMMMNWTIQIRHLLIVLLSIILMCLFGSCSTDLEFDGSTKYEITGTITDINGERLEGIPIALLDTPRRTSFGFLGQIRDYNHLSQLGVTDENGEFYFVVNEINFEDRVIQINSPMFPTQADPDPKFANKTTLIIRGESVDYTYTLDETLRDGAQLIISNPHEDEIDINIEHDHINELLTDLESTNIPIDTLISYTVPKDTPVRLSYRIPDTTFIWIDTTFIITSDTLNYAL